MGLAYWLVARGLRVVSAQEAGIITLLEPILNPIWAYLVSPRTEVPSPFTLMGGTVGPGAHWLKRRIGRGEKVVLDYNNGRSYMAVIDLLAI